MKSLKIIQIHKSGLIKIPYSYIATNSYLDVNISITLNLLEVAKQIGLKKINHVSNNEMGKINY